MRKLAAIAATALATTAMADEFLLIFDSTTGSLFDPYDGSLVDPSFIQHAAAGRTTPIEGVMVGSEIWVSDQLADALFRYDAKGAFLGLVQGGMDNVRGIEHVDGVVYVSNAGTIGGAPGQAIVTLDTDGTLLESWPVVGSPFDVLAYEGDLLVSNITHDRIDLHQPDGEFIEIFSDSGINFPQQVALMSSGNILVGGFSSPAGVYEFDATTRKMVNYWAASGVRGVRELGNGNIMFTNSTGVNIIDRATGAITRIRFGGHRFISLIDTSPGADPACDPVSIVSAPSDASVCDGQEALFEVIAEGSELEYEWRGPGGPVPGATSSLLLLSSVDAFDAGLYEVTITNDCSQQVVGATLDVHPTGPDITQHPEPAGPLCPGRVAVFSVGAQGHIGGALSYQWYKDCTPILGATADTLEVLVAGIEDQGQYKVRVTEAGCGSADSFPAMLYVSNDPPQITLNGDAYMVLECGDSYTEQGAQVSDDCDSGLVATITGSVDTHTLGNYELEYDVTDSQGNAATTVSRWVTVADTTPPEVVMSIDNPILWSPNHELVNVGLLAGATDLCDPLGAASSLEIMVFCDERELPDTGDGTGKHSPDAKDIAPVTLRLRSERQGKSDGRVYIIVATAMDASGNVGFRFSSVVCPKSSDPADLAAADAQALTAISAAADAASSGLPGEGVVSVVDALTGLGYQLHGVQPESGPHQ